MKKFLASVLKSLPFGKRFRVGLLFLFFIFSFSFSKAQWVTIPDANFVSILQALYPSCMNGNLLDTICASNSNVTSMIIPGQNLSDITGVQYFDSLQTLSCYNNNLTFLPSLPSLLVELDCSDNILTNLPSLPNSINQLLCEQNQLTTLPVLPTNLTFFQCDMNQLTSLPTLPNNIDVLRCYNNSLTSLPHLPSSLGSLQCANNLLTELPSLPNSLGQFLIQNNPLTCIPPLKLFTGNGFQFNISGTSVTCLPNVIQHPGYIPAIDTMPVCDLFNSNGCPIAWNISGTTYNDEDGSCSTLNDETNITHVKLNLFNSSSNLIQQIISNWNGNYSFDTQLGTYSVSVDTTYLPFNVLCPLNNMIGSNLTAIDSFDYNSDFRLTCKQGFDLAVWDMYDETFFSKRRNCFKYQSWRFCSKHLQCQLQFRHQRRSKSCNQWFCKLCFAIGRRAHTNSKWRYTYLHRCRFFIGEC